MLAFLTCRIHSVSARNNHLFYDLYIGTHHSFVRLQTSLNIYDFLHVIPLRYNPVQYCILMCNYYSDHI